MTNETIGSADREKLKIASFRTKEGVWADFIAAAAKVELTGTDVLRAAMDDFMAGEYMPKVKAGIHTAISTPSITKEEIQALIDDALEQHIKNQPPMDIGYVLNQLAGMAERIGAIEQKQKSTDQAILQTLTDEVGAMAQRMDAIDWLTTQVTIQEANWKTFDELSQRVTKLERATTSTAGHPSPPANKATTVTAKPSTNGALNAEDLKMVDRLKREPALRAAAAEALAQDGTSKDVSQRLFDAGHRNTKGEAFDTTVITRMRKAIAHLNG